MLLDQISSGINPPNDINVVIEIAMNSDPVKYEIDNESGALIVDRICGAAMFYPCNYGFIPHTMADDKDPLDVMLVCRYPLMVGSVINARPIGVVHMEDEKGKDEKIIAVPSSKIYKYYDNVNNIQDLSSCFIEEIRHFFTHYKDLEVGKWVKIESVSDVNDAKNVISKYLVKR